MYLLHLHYPAIDLHQTIAFPSAFLRALHMILLASQPVGLRTEDRS